MDSLNEVLKEVFIVKVKDKLFSYLKNGTLRDVKPELISQLIKEIIEETREVTEKYLQDNEIGLENMDSEIDKLINQKIVPYILKLKVKP